MMYVSDLSAPKQRLLRLFQAINFGRVEELEVREGEPQFSPRRRRPARDRQQDVPGRRPVWIRRDGRNRPSSHAEHGRGEMAESR